MPFIEVTAVSKSFAGSAGTRHVLRDVSLGVEHGEFVSIVGAMGSGKSTLLSLLAGLTSPDAGRIVIGGEPVRGIRKDGAFVFQNYSLLPWFTALENVRLAVEAAFPDLSRQAQRARAVETLERVGLGSALNRRPRQLSGGMRQRVSIARAFATRPEVLFLDEPFGALDALTRETLQQELARLCTDGERPVTTVMITNNVEEAILLSDRIIPMIPGPLDFARGAVTLRQAQGHPEHRRGVSPADRAPATLGTPIPVELSRPRTVAQLAHDEQATHARGHVIAALTAALGRKRVSTSSGAVPSAVLQPATEETR
jgi:nitrate/nitrite transport system ATP-binding protein